MSVMSVVPRFLLIGLAALGLALPACAQPTMPAPAELKSIVTALDKQHFDAFNSCDLKTIESLYIPDVEFYHDLNARVLNREQLLAAIQKNICGKVQRRLLEPPEVYPMAGFGAIEMAKHCFYRLGQTNCEQEGKTFMLWKFDGANWQLTRVVSFDHRNLP